jgi:hypothetical protein
LAHVPPEIQGAVLAELLSLWVAGFYQGGDAAMWGMLEMHMGMVRKFVPVNVNILKGGP